MFDEISNKFTKLTYRNFINKENRSNSGGRIVYWLQE